MNQTKIFPTTTKRIIATAFGDDHYNNPLATDRPTISQGELTPTPQNKNLNKTLNLENAKSSWEDFKKTSQRKSLYWVCSSVFIGAWLIVMTTYLAYHIQNIDGKIKSSICKDDTTCTYPTPYCDAKYTFECSQCTDSSHCNDATKKVCDIYGTRSCHECVVDKDCKGIAKLCDHTDTRTCVECFSNTDCASNAIKNTCYSQKCVQCVDNNDCASQPVNKICSSSTNTCV